MEVANQEQHLELEERLKGEKEDFNSGKTSFSKGPNEESDQVQVSLPKADGTTCKLRNNNWKNMIFPLFSQQKI